MCSEGANAMGAVLALSHIGIAVKTGQEQTTTQLYYEQFALL
jgi:hypothetical protein